MAFNMNKHKRQLLELLLRHGMVKLLVDPMAKDVEVPPKYRIPEALPLNLSKRFPNTDMVINDECVDVSLTFGGDRFRCHLPWEAIAQIGAATGSTPLAPPEPPKPKLKMIACNEDAKPDETPRPRWLQIVREEAP